MRRSLVSLPILLVLSGIFFIYYTTVFVVIDEWLGLSTSQGLMNASFFTILALMSVVTYAIAIVRDPGHVPSSYVPDVEDSDSPIHEIKRKVRFFIESCWLFLLFDFFVIRFWLYLHVVVHFMCLIVFLI